MAGVAMALGGLTKDPLAAVLWISLSVAMSMFTLGAAWSTCIDIAGSHSGVVSAAMNTAGQIAGIVSPLMVVWLVDATGDWITPVYAMSALFAVGTVCWLFVNPRNKVFE